MAPRSRIAVCSNTVAYRGYLTQYSQVPFYRVEIDIATNQRTNIRAQSVVSPYGRVKLNSISSYIHDQDIEVLSRLVEELIRRFGTRSMSPLSKNIH